MTTTDTTNAGTEMTETDPKGATAPEGQADPPEGQEPINNPEAAAASRDAAAFRRKLREAEAELATYRRRDAEALVGSRLLSASDLWVAGVKLEDLQAEDGSVDKAKVDEAVAKVLEERPHWKPQGPRVPRDLGQGRRGGTVGGDVSWASVLKGRG